MIYEDLGKKFIENGYRQMTSNVPEISIYFKEAEGRARVISLINFHDLFHFSKEQFAHLKNQIINLFQNRNNQTIELLFLVCTKKTEEAKSAFIHEPGVWIVDEESQRLFIYENQPRDFYGVKSLIEGTLSENLANGSYHQEILGKRKLTTKEWIKVKPVCNITVIVINIIAFIVLEFGGNTESAEYMLRKGAMAAPLIYNEHEFYRFITSLFMHFGINHLFNNMLVLFFLGDNLERAIGKIKYILIYLLSGISGSMLSLLLTNTNNGYVVSAGASGAIFGVMGALFSVVILNRGRLEDLTLKKLGFLIFLTLYQGFTSTGVDNFAHVGGMVAGIILALILYRKPVKMYN